MQRMLHKVIWDFKHAMQIYKTMHLKVNKIFLKIKKKKVDARPMMQAEAIVKDEQ